MQKTKLSSVLISICQSLRLADYFIIIIIISTSIFFIIFTSSTKGKYVKVQALDKTIIQPLDKDLIFTVEGDNGESVIQIKEGKVRMLSSECPEQTCVKMGWGKTIVCLPNNVIISVMGDDTKGQVDEVTF